MNILRLYPFLPPMSGGMEKHIAHLSLEQMSLGHEVSVFFNQGDVTSANDVRLLPLINLRVIKPQVVRDAVFYIAVLLHLATSRKSYDVVHVHGDWSAFFFATALRIFCKKMVASIHGGIKDGFFWQKIYKKSLEKFDLIYSTGLKEAKLLTKLLNRDVYWQNSGIGDVFFEGGCFGLIERDVDVVCVSNFYPVKNVKLVVDVAILLPKYSFCVIGDGPLYLEILEYCQSKGVKNVDFLGGVSPERVAEKLRTAKVYLSTSFVEGTPTAMIEAMACGLAVISGKSNDYSRLIYDGINGFVVHDFSPETFSACLEKALGNKTFLDGASQYNRSLASGYSWKQVSLTITSWFSENEK